MTSLEFAEKIIKLPVEKQNEFFEKLKNKLSEEDWLTTVKFVSLLGLFKNPAKYEAVKNALCDTICEEFYGHTVEKQKTTEDNILINMYSNSIL